MNSVYLLRILEYPWIQLCLLIGRALQLYTMEPAVENIVVYEQFVLVCVLHFLKINLLVIH